MEFTHKIKVIYDDGPEYTEKEIKDKKILNKLKVNGIAYKHRLYYSNIWDENKDVLTFIMYNPSTANQYSNDSTIQNCITIAKGLKIEGLEGLTFGGIKVFNILTARHPIKKEIKEIDNPNDYDIDFIEKYSKKGKDIVLAWGDKRINSKMEETLEMLHQAFNNKTFYELKLEDKPTKYPRHPGNQGWAHHGGIKNAELKEIKDTNRIKDLMRIQQI